MQELTYFLDFRQIISVLQIISRTITISLKFILISYLSYHILILLASYNHNIG